MKLIGVNSKAFIKRIVSFVMIIIIIISSLSFGNPMRVSAAGTEMVETFSYIGESKPWTVPYTGWYTIELWGAQGGADNAYNPKGGVGLVSGGTGAYVSADVRLTKGQVLYINVGGGGDVDGNDMSYSYNSSLGVNVLNSRDGAGWNGGGAPTSNTLWGRSGGGGGATDIRIGDNNINSRIMIAGGGGGGSGYFPGEGASRFYDKTAGTVTSGDTGTGTVYSFTTGTNGLYKGKWQGQDQMQTASNGNNSGGGGGGGYYGGRSGLDDNWSAMGGLSFVGSPDDTSKGTFTFKNIKHVAGVKLTDSDKVAEIWNGGKYKYIGVEAPTDSYSFYTANDISYHIRGTFEVTKGWDGYAKITRATGYTLTFNDNGGSGGPGTWKVYYGSSEGRAVSGYIPTRVGYKFTGWYTAASGGTMVYDATGYAVKCAYWSESRDNGGVWIGTSDLTVYAHWEITDRAGPTITVTPPSCDWCKSVDVTVSVTDGGSGVWEGNRFDYFLSDSSNDTTATDITSYTNNKAFTIGEGLNGTYYLYVRNVRDVAGNWADSTGHTPVQTDDGYYFRFGSYNFDNTAPTITTVTEDLDETYTTTCISISSTDEGGSGLSDANEYEYYVSSSAAALADGSWEEYSDGEVIDIGYGLTGSYYLFIKQIADNVGNTSLQDGTIVEIDGVAYHRQGPFNFDNTDDSAPTGTVTYYENNRMLGLWGDYVSEPYAVMKITDAVDNLEGIERIYLEIYDKANPDNRAEFEFVGEGQEYECVFNLYSALTDSEYIETVHMAVWVVDKAGNVSSLPITGYDFGIAGNGAPVTAEDIGFREDDIPDNAIGYERDAFRVEARVINKYGENWFRGGDVAYLEIYTYGYVEAVEANFNSLTSQINPQYDKQVNLIVTDIPVQERYVYTHKFFIPLYAIDGVYTDNNVEGYKKTLSQNRNITLNIAGCILYDIKTILK